MKQTLTEIMIEVEEVIHVVSHRHGVTRAWCTACGSEAPMLTPERAAALAKVTVRAVNQRVEEGSVHFRETADGGLWVCANSLADY